MLQMGLEPTNPWPTYVGPMWPTIQPKIGSPIMCSILTYQTRSRWIGPLKPSTSRAKHVRWLCSHDIGRRRVRPWGQATCGPLDMGWTKLGYLGWTKLKVGTGQSNQAIGSGQIASEAPTMSNQHVGSVQALVTDGLNWARPNSDPFCPIPI